MKVERREFIKTSVGAGIAVAILNHESLFAAENIPNSQGIPDLVAIRDGDRATMTRRAVEELGGMKAFVKEGQTVVIKPNIGWDKGPDMGANSHPDVVATLVTMCKEAGAKSVTVFDHTCHDAKRAYKGSGIQDAVEAAGGVMAMGDQESHYVDKNSNQAKSMKAAKIHKLVVESDVFINCPPLKHHSGSQMTACMKNAMGLVWDRQFLHANDLHQCIADAATFRKPDLNILDAYNPMIRNGPVGKDKNDLIESKTLLASRDIVAIDAAGAAILNQSGKIRHVLIGEEMGLGCADLGKLNVKRIKL